MESMDNNRFTPIVLKNRPATTVAGRLPKRCLILTVISSNQRRCFRIITRQKVYDYNFIKMSNISKIKIYKPKYGKHTHE